MRAALCHRADAGPSAALNAGANANACALANVIASANAYAIDIASKKETLMIELKLQLHFSPGYIAHPYWQETERLISIQKESGMRRARSEKNRDEALSQYLKRIGMTEKQYAALEKAVQRPFYTAADEERDSHGRHPLDGHDPDEIVIPPKQIDGMLANASDEAKSSIRIVDRGRIRSVLRASPIYTGKTQPDGIWERFVVVTAGTGAKLSNQRGFRSSAFLEEFDAELKLEFNPELVRADKVKDFIRFAGRDVGIGAARKMRWGRFEVIG